MAAAELLARAPGISDAAKAELQGLAKGHPDSVAVRLTYNHNNYMVVSMPHLLAAIAHTSNRSVHDVACYKEKQQVWEFLSGGMEIMQQVADKLLWPGGVSVGEDMMMVSPAKVVKLYHIRPGTPAAARGKDKAAAYVQALADGRRFDLAAYNRMLLTAPQPVKSEGKAKFKRKFDEMALPPLTGFMTEQSLRIAMQSYFCLNAQHLAAQANIICQQASLNREMAVWVTGMQALPSAPEEGPKDVPAAGVSID